MGLDILVVSACSGSKRYEPVITAEWIDEYSREELAQKYPDQTISAEEQYTGNEHQHVRAAVDWLEEMANVRWVIISAGFGVIEHNTEIPSYDCTFSDIESVRERASRLGRNVDTMTNSETIESVGEEIEIPRDLEQIFAEGYDFLFVILGGSYLVASECALNSIPDDISAFAFAAEGNRDLIGDCQWIPATEEERAELETVWTELRGRQFRKFVEDIDSVRDLSGLDATAVHELSLGQG